MDLRMKCLIYFLLVLGGMACTEDGIAVYEKKGSKLFSKYIFALDGGFFFTNLKDSSDITVIGKNKILVNQDILFKKLNDLSAQVNGPLSLEASNHESGRYSLDNNFNYDLRFNGNELLVRIYRSDHRSVCYLIKPDQEYTDLLKKAINNFVQKRGSHHRVSETDNSVTFSIKLNGRTFRRSKSINDDDVILLYESIRFTLMKNLKDKSKYQAIPDTLKVQTSERYFGLRHVAPKPGNK
jgi:hypothetical protein